MVQAEADPADIPDWAMGFTPLAERLYADSLFLTKVHDPSSSPEAPNNGAQPHHTHPHTHTTSTGTLGLRTDPPTARGGNGGGGRDRGD